MSERPWVYASQGVVGFFGDGPHPMALNLETLDRAFVDGGDETGYFVTFRYPGSSANLQLLPSFSSRVSAEAALADLFKSAGRVVFPQ